MKIVLGAVIVLGGIATSAIGQTVSRVYTQFDADKCRHAKGRDVEDYGSWRCPGHAGIDVYLSAGDQRMHVMLRPQRRARTGGAPNVPRFQQRL